MSLQSAACLALILSCAACGASSDQVAALLAQADQAQSERAAMRAQVAALSKRLDEAEVAKQTSLARIEQGSAGPPVPAPTAITGTAPLSPAEDPTAIGRCKSLQDSGVVRQCSTYKPEGSAWSDATGAARFGDPSVLTACRAEDVCMILTYGDTKGYQKTKALAQSLKAKGGGPGKVADLGIYFNDDMLLVLKVDSRISSTTLAKVTKALGVDLK